MYLVCSNFLQIYEQNRKLGFLCPLESLWLLLLLFNGLSWSWPDIMICENSVLVFVGFLSPSSWKPGLCTCEANVLPLSYIPSSDTSLLYGKNWIPLFEDNILLNWGSRLVFQIIKFDCKCSSVNLSLETSFHTGMWWDRCMQGAQKAMNYNCVTVTCSLQSSSTNQ